MTTTRPSTIAAARAMIQPGFVYKGVSDNTWLVVAVYGRNELWGPNRRPKGRTHAALICLTGLAHENPDLVERSTDGIARQLASGRAIPLSEDEAVTDALRHRDIHPSPEAWALAACVHDRLAYGNPDDAAHPLAIDPAAVLGDFDTTPVRHRAAAVEVGMEIEVLLAAHGYKVVPID
jgi:hypothetical protein